MKIISFYSDQIYQDFFPLGFGWVLYIYIYEMRQKHNGTNCKHIQLECWGHMQQIRSWMPRYGVYQQNKDFASFCLPETKNGQTCLEVSIRLISCL